MKKPKDISLCIDIYGGCDKCKKKTKCVDRGSSRKELLKKILSKIEKRK